jgi:hypothetical protein
MLLGTLEQLLDVMPLVGRQGATLAIGDLEHGFRLLCETQRDIGHDGGPLCGLVSHAGDCCCVCGAPDHGFLLGI